MYMICAFQKAKDAQRDADKKMNELMAEWKKADKKKEEEINREKDKVVDLSAKIEELSSLKSQVVRRQGFRLKCEALHNVHYFRSPISNPDLPSPTPRTPSLRPRIKRH